MTSRRGFIRSTLGAGLALATQGCQQIAAPFSRKRTIVDAQVHLWKAETPDWRWVPGAKPQLNDYALEAARRHPDRFAVMGLMPLRNPQSAALLAKWKEQPGMLGVRVTFFGGAAAWLSDGTADWLWPAAEKAGWTASAIEHTLSLARYPNVSVKLSAVPNYSSENYPFRDMNVHIRRLFDAYGPRRCYWGTDLTNGLAKATYRQRITHFTEELDFLSEEDRDWVMGRGILARLKWV